MRESLRRLTAITICCAAVLSGQIVPARGSAVQAPFTDLPGVLALPQAQRLQPVKGAEYSVRQSAIENPKSKIQNRPSAAPCEAFTASTPASWFAADSDGAVDTDTEVDNYPSGTVVIAPGFKYDCAPQDIDIIVVIYNQAYGSDPALVEKRTLQATPTAGIFFYALTTPDGSPLQEGRWRIAFYQNKTTISSGDILLGGVADLDVTRQAAVQGSVTDQRTGQPVWQARIFVLKPGVSLEDFMQDTQRDDIFVQTRTDAEGQFSLWKPLDRNTQYAMLIAADGYKLRGTDRLIIGDQATSPVALSIQLVKR